MSRFCRAIGSYALAPSRSDPDALAPSLARRWWWWWFAGDETGNFTGMDEYWAGMRRFDDEGEEIAWWNDYADEGDVYDWEDEGNYTGCNWCAAREKGLSSTRVCHLCGLSHAL